MIAWSLSMMTAASNPFKDEELGSSAGEVLVAGSGVTTLVDMHRGVHRASLVSEALISGATTQGQAYLAIDDMRGERDAVVLHVGLELPGDGAAIPSQPYVAGSVGLYGLRRASSPHAGSPGRGLSFVLDITPFFDSLRSQRPVNIEHLLVTLRPHPPLSEGHSLAVGRLRIFRRIHAFESPQRSHEPAQ